MAESHVTCIPDNATHPHNSSEWAKLILEVFYAIGAVVYGKDRDTLEDKDVSVFPHTAEAGAISGTHVEVRVELASGDWRETESEYDELAQAIFDLIYPHAGMDNLFPFVWVTGGPFTGFADCPRGTNPPTAIAS